MPGGSVYRDLREVTLTSRLTVRKVLAIGGCSRLISSITAFTYGIFELTVLKSSVSDESISASSRLRHSGRLSSSMSSHAKL